MEYYNVSIMCQVFLDNSANSELGKPRVLYTGGDGTVYNTRNEKQWPVDWFLPAPHVTTLEARRFSKNLQRPLNGKEIFHTFAAGVRGKNVVSAGAAQRPLNSSR